MAKPTLRDLFNNSPRVVNLGFDLLLVIKYQKALERIETAKKTGWNVDAEQYLVKARQFQYTRGLESIRAADEDSLNRASWLFQLNQKSARIVARALTTPPGKPPKGSRAQR